MFVCICVYCIYVSIYDCRDVVLYIIFAHMLCECCVPSAATVRTLTNNVLGRDVRSRMCDVHVRIPALRPQPNLCWRLLNGILM